MSATDIVLVTCNARHSHTALGLRCILANLGQFRARASMLEVALDVPAARIAARVADLLPRIVGLSVHIWNARQMQALAEDLRRRLPDVVLVAGGPELFYEAETHPISAGVDYVLSGEGEVWFRDLCAAVLGGTRVEGKFHQVGRLDLAAVRRPDGEYGVDQDLGRRLVYVETSRGCPFGCEYCLSARDRVVRRYPLESVFAGIDGLLARGARVLKFVDRTFNQDMDHAVAVLEFVKARALPGRVFHFEMVPDRFPPELRTALRGFPAGALRIEVGIQSFDPEVNERVGRRWEPAVAEDALAFLRSETGAVVHADLIAGLPGETLAGFAAGFDRLLALGPDEMQLGLLKLLRGTPLIRHVEPWHMRFSPDPPYVLMDSSHLPAADIGRVTRLGYLWERLYNRHRFRTSLPLLWAGGGGACSAVLDWSDWLLAREGRGYGFALDHLAERLFEYLVQERRGEPRRAASAIWADYRVTGQGPPRALRPHLGEASREY